MTDTLVTKDNGEGLATVERTRGGPTYTPRVDILETEAELRVFADLPGVQAEDLDIRFEDHELTIHGKVASRHADVEPLLSEYGIGDFYRTFRIGESIDATKISADLNNGVLTLHLPKTEKVKPRRIEVKTG
jgi:HSP20 family molecular chaperone IbpA